MSGGTDELPARMAGWPEKLTMLIPWLDMIDKVATNAGRSDLVGTEMQDDIRQMAADFTAAIDAVLDYRRGADAEADAGDEARERVRDLERAVRYAVEHGGDGAPAVEPHPLNVLRSALNRVPVDWDAHRWLSES